ncbi:hypothetical protein ACFVFI_19425 [Streptomyces sp. NPDC057705]|uniref:hypothetical protein n=1 Tax=Streptomyces sp. NPDC057705 TaxID=3346222 RepID=UPI0036758E15
MLQQSGLYHPYIHFRDDSRLKAAALYRPRLGRVVPAGHPVMDSRTVGRLTEALDFVHDVDPAAAARTVADDFPDVLTADPEGPAGTQPPNAGREGRGPRTGPRLSRAAEGAGGPRGAWRGPTAAGGTGG